MSHAQFTAICLGILLLMGGQLLWFLAITGDLAELRRELLKKLEELKK